MTQHRNEYLKRNLELAKAYGAHAAVKRALHRLHRLRHRQQWLIDLLKGADERLQHLPKALIVYRDSALRQQPKEKYHEARG